MKCNHPLDGDTNSLKSGHNNSLQTAEAWLQELQLSGLKPLAPVKHVAPDLVQVLKDCLNSNPVRPTIQPTA